MKCSKCHFENTDDSVFCSKCGAKLSNQQTDRTNRTNFFNKKNTLILVALVLVLVVGSLLLFTKNPVEEYQEEIRNNNAEAANAIYNDSIKGNIDKEDKVKSILMKESNSIKDAYKNNKIEFEEATKRITTIQNTNLISEARSNFLYINQLHSSREALKKAQEYQDKKNYISAIEQYNNVTKEDENYELAQKEIKEMEGLYKKEVLNKIQEYENNQEYEKAITLLREADSIIKKDSDIVDKLAQMETKQTEKQEAQQLIIVENSKITVQHSTYKNIYPDMIQVTIKNTSDKTVKQIEVASLAYDANGYPVKIKRHLSFFDPEYEFIGVAEDVNIVPGARFGDGVGWEVDENHGIATVLSCVKNATFYDGSVWQNPYYHTWLKKYKEKPLK